MVQLSSGNFFGKTDHKLEADGLILTNTMYTHDYVDWHHHENAYFTFVLFGHVIEGSKKGKVNLSSGSLLFHHSQESHYNIKPKGATRGMHLELKENWMNNVFKTEGSFEVACPKTKLLFYKILHESRMSDDVTLLGVHNLVIEAMDSLFPAEPKSVFHPPWVKTVADLLQDSYPCPPDLKALATLVGVHPVHLSRSFARYFGCTMADYIRQLKVIRALAKLPQSGNSLSTIAHASGFADQSHMIRCFKAYSGTTPSIFRKLINS